MLITPDYPNCDVDEFKKDRVLKIELLHNDDLLKIRKDQKGAPDLMDYSSENISGIKAAQMLRPYEYEVYGKLISSMHHVDTKMTDDHKYVRIQGWLPLSDFVSLGQGLDIEAWIVVDYDKVIIRCWKLASITNKL